MLTQGKGNWMPMRLMKQVALCLTGYYQDIIADFGVWHAFIDECRRMYGRTLPFFDTADDYLDYELNPEDVRFLVWYASAMSEDEFRDISPLDPRLEKLADAVYAVLEENYEEAPIPKRYEFLREVELHDPDDRETIVDFSRWLFLFNYLMTPAFALTLHNILKENTIDFNKDPDGAANLTFKMMEENTLGPLAFYLNEWVALIISGKLPRIKEPKPIEAAPHKYYQRVTEAFSGKTILYFKTYEELNDFFINVIGWEKGERHLSALEAHEYFAVMVEREKGMLVAHDVARSIADPDNPLYDPAIAANEAFLLLTERGRCPHDLLMKIKENGWLPDARFPGTDDTALVSANFDFIARCWLQDYYRGD